MRRQVSLFPFVVVLLVMMVWPAARARADELEYSHLDDATVRVFSYKGVAVVRARGASGQAYVLAVPDAGHGSGLLVSPDGLILTARHAIEDARIIAVQFPGQKQALPARVVYEDPEHDHAFLVVEGRYKTHVEIPKQSPKLAVRETVYVVGYPLDASRERAQSQQGIVSGVLPDGSLQLGIALNPGNSGGPVVDANERLIGIAVARADPKAGAQGIGVALPIEQILPGYQRMLRSRELQTVKKELMTGGPRLKAEAELLSALLTAEDADAAWRALRGKKQSSPTSRDIDQRLQAAFKTQGTPSPEVLSVAAAQLWNAAAVFTDRRQSADEPLNRARQYAKQAVSLDAEVVKRSPFIAFVVDGHEPTDVALALPSSASEDDEEEGDESIDAMDELMNSLETNKSLPTLRIGPTIGITTPFQILGIGVVAKMHFGQLLNIDARYQYGWHAGDSDLEGSHLFEALGGIALSTWNGTTTTQLVVDVEHQFNTTIFRYVPGQIPTVHSVVAEAGLLSGPVNLLTPDAMLGSLHVVKQVYVIEGGIRYTYFYLAKSPYLARNARSTVELSAHLLAPPLGMPDGATNADGEEINRALPGFKADVAWGSAPLSWGQTEIGAGYFPATGWIYFRFGWTYLFY